MIADNLFLLAAALFPFVFPYLVLHEMFGSRHGRAWGYVAAGLFVTASVWVYFEQAVSTEAGAWTTAALAPVHALFLIYPAAFSIMTVWIVVGLVARSRR